MPLPILELPDDALQCIFKSFVALTDYYGVAAMLRSVLRVAQMRRNREVLRILYAALCEKRQRDCGDATATLGSCLEGAADAEHVARVAYRLERVWHISDLLIGLYIIDRVSDLVYEASLSSQFAYPDEYAWFCSQDSWYTTSASWQDRCRDTSGCIKGSGIWRQLNLRFSGTFEMADDAMKAAGTYANTISAISEWKRDTLGRFFMTEDSKELSMGLLGPERTESLFAHAESGWSHAFECISADPDDGCDLGRTLRRLKVHEADARLDRIMTDMLKPYVLREIKTFLCAARGGLALEVLFGPLRTALSKVVLYDRPAFWKKRRLLSFMSRWRYAEDRMVALELAQREPSTSTF